jgi:hypothetical protein
MRAGRAGRAGRSTTPQRAELAADACTVQVTKARPRRVTDTQARPGRCLHPATFRSLHPTTTRRRAGARLGLTNLDPDGLSSPIGRIIPGQALLTSPGLRRILVSPPGQTGRRDRPGGEHKPRSRLQGLQGRRPRQRHGCSAHSTGGISAPAPRPGPWTRPVCPSESQQPRELGGHVSTPGDTGESPLYDQLFELRGGWATSTKPHQGRMQVQALHLAPCATRRTDMGRLVAARPCTTLHARRCRRREGRRRRAGGFDPHPVHRAPPGAPNTPGGNTP